MNGNGQTAAVFVVGQIEYNPFVYLRDDNDVQRLVTNLFKSTTPKGSQSNDPFWDTAASMLLLALIFYLKYEAPPDEQNFPTVMEMLRAADVREDCDEYTSPLDELFERLEMRNPDHIAVKYYKDYHSGSAKTLKSIQITLAARLEKFNLSSLAALTATDELDLPSLGEKKVALFALIPDNDTSFNFLVSILYTQLFQQLAVAFLHIQKIQHPHLIALLSQQMPRTAQQLAFRVEHGKARVGLTQIRFGVKSRLACAAAADNDRIEVAAVLSPVQSHPDILCEDLVGLRRSRPVFSIDGSSRAPLGRTVFLTAAVIAAGR